MAKEFDNPQPPYAFVQYKGTDICMDFHCLCGAMCHFDGDFAYTVQCPHCARVWEMPHYIYPREANSDTHPHWRENPKLLDPDEDCPNEFDPDTDIPL